MSEYIGAKKRLLEHFLANIGRVIDNEEIRDIGDASEWARRIRELREDGYKILTKTDRADLKVGQYVMPHSERGEGTGKRSISKTTRALVFQRDGSVCYSCGAVAGEPHPVTDRSTVLQIGHLTAKSHGGRDNISNLRPQCTECNSGGANILPELPTDKRLIAETRKATEADQYTLFSYLKSKFDQPRL